ILYGVVAEASIDDLFRAGILPGLLMVVLLAGYGFIRNRHTAMPRVPGREVLGAILDAKWDIPLPVVVLGGIYSGYFAISEAAAVTALYVLVVELIVLREIRVEALPRIVRESMVLVGAILTILGMSLASTNYLIDVGVPQRLFEVTSQFVSGHNTFLLALPVFLLALGAILDIFSAIALVVAVNVRGAAAYRRGPAH